MLGLGGYRDFQEYNARSQSDPLQQIFSYHGLNRGYRLIDSDTDSDNEFSDAISHLGEQQALEANYGGMQCYTDLTPGDYLHQAFEYAAECKVRFESFRSVQHH